VDHIVFFSYARSNLDPYLADFFKDLCGEIAPNTEWSPDDEQISFQDKKNLRVMANWESDIKGALQGSSVLVCITSLAYFKSSFCGKEYYVFDQRRRHGIGQGADPPPVILPVIWAPVVGGILDFMNTPQQVPQGVADIYLEKGLRYLKRFEPESYNRCVTAFAEAIYDAWLTHGNIDPLAYVQRFDEIPNAFQGGDWQEAAGPAGWLPGPDVVNFVFAAGLRQEIPTPNGRYGAMPADWRPYLPPVGTTIREYARQATRKHSLRFREIALDEGLEIELRAARDRKNLTLVLADPRTLPIGSYRYVESLDALWWEGAALLLPCDGVAAEWNAETQGQVIRRFPVISQLKPPTFQAPIRSAEDLETSLDVTLAELRALVTRTESVKKERTDHPPSQIVGSGGVSA
jgi:hypothetical protein